MEVPISSTVGFDRYRSDLVIGAGAVPGPASGDRDAGSAYRNFQTGSDCQGLGGSRALVVPQLGSQNREWLRNVRRSIGSHATKALPYKALMARPEELESPTF